MSGMSNVPVMIFEGTATFWELARSAFPFFGALFSLWMIWDCWQDLGATEDQDAGEINHIAAVQAVRNEVFVLLSQVTLVYIGLLAASTPPFNPDAPITDLSIVTSVGITIVSLLLPIKSLWNRIDRRRMVSLVRQAIRKERQVGC